MTTKSTKILVHLTGKSMQIAARAQEWRNKANSSLIGRGYIEKELIAR